MSKRKQLREKRMRQQKMQRIYVIGAIVVGAVLVAFAFIYPNIRPIGEILPPPSGEYPMANGNGLGDPNAPVKIVEFSDFQCPFCARFWEQTEPRIIADYVATGKVYFEYRSMGNFVSDNINRSVGTNNTESQDAIHAAYCAGDQNRFWEYHSILFANHTGENVGDYSSRRLTAYAETLGLDMAAFNSCMDSNKYLDRVTQDGVDGRAAGITGTPSFLINGKLVVGAQPYEVFQQEIEAALAAVGQ